MKNIGRGLTQESISEVAFEELSQRTVEYLAESFSTLKSPLVGQAAGGFPLSVGRGS